MDSVNSLQILQTVSTIFSSVKTGRDWSLYSSDLGEIPEITNN